jgi:hypothetical protein
MNDELDFEKFVNERNKVREELERMDELVKAYKRVTPKVAPIWDTASSSIQFNDISHEILEIGMDIYIPHPTTMSGKEYMILEYMRKILCGRISMTVERLPESLMPGGIIRLYLHCFSSSMYAKIWHWSQMESTV